MATNASIQELLNFTPLTKAVKLVASGIPNTLDSKFFSITEPVLGDRAKNFQFRGNRKLARKLPYGAPPRQREMLPLELDNIRLLHFSEKLVANQILLTILQQYEKYDAQPNAEMELDRQSEEFGVTFQNTRIASVNSLIINGKLWFDVDGYLQSTSSGADLEVDYGVPAGNRGDVSGIITAPWSTATTDIELQVRNIQKKVIQATGYPIENAWYGVNIPSYVARNTGFQFYLARNPGFNQNYINNPGSIPDGTLGIKRWTPVQNMFYEDISGTVVEQQLGDQITFGPDINAQTYTMYEGSYRVPKSFQPVADLQAALANTELVYGMFRFAHFLMPMNIEFTQGDTFLPKIKNPANWIYADTTP